MNSARRDLLIASATLALLVASVEAAGQTRLPPQTPQSAAARTRGRTARPRLVGRSFELRAEVMRLGSRVASTRMEFLDAQGKLLSTGAGAYIVS